MSKELEKTFLNALEQNQQKLLRICSVYAKDADDTKDLFQEVLVQIWRSMQTFESKSSIGTWMFRITLNVCLRFRSKENKKQKQFIQMDSITIAKFIPTKEDYGEQEKLAHLKSCIKKLNEADKAVITLYLEEVRYKEISEILGLSENNVAVKVKRIKKKLLNCINQIT